MFKNAIALPFESAITVAFESAITLTTKMRSFGF
jgi:hypothetical protein